MPFRLGRGGKRRGSFFAQRGERRYFARFFLPLLDRSRIANNSDLALVIGKTHSPAKVLFVQISQTCLIAMMVRRAEQRPAQLTARDVGEIAFDRFRLGDVDLVKIFSRKTKSVVFKKLPIR